MPQRPQILSGRGVGLAERSEPTHIFPLRYIRWLGFLSWWQVVVPEFIGKIMQIRKQL